MTINNPVESCYSWFDKLHTTIPKYFPCCYFVYRFGVIPDRTDFDLFTLISKVRDVSFAFFLLKHLVHCTHPVMWMLPVVPLIADILRLLYHSIFCTHISSKDKSSPTLTTSH